jgi:hypothetical protein
MAWGSPANVGEIRSARPEQRVFHRLGQRHRSSKDNFHRRFRRRPGPDLGTQLFFQLRVAGNHLVCVENRRLRLAGCRGCPPAQLGQLLEGRPHRILAALPLDRCILSQAASHVDVRSLEDESRPAGETRRSRDALDALHGSPKLSSTSWLL